MNTKDSKNILFIQGQISVFSWLKGVIDIGIQIDKEFLNDNELALFKRLSEQVHINYQDYLNSPEWKTRARAAKQRAGNRCQLCNKSGNETPLHTHHRTYERIGNENDDDLTVLCSDCHAKFHDKD